MPYSKHIQNIETKTKGTTLSPASGNDVGESIFFNTGLKFFYQQF